MPCELLRQYGLAEDDAAIDADTATEHWPCWCPSWRAIGRCGHEVVLRLRGIMARLTERQATFFIRDDGEGLGKKLRRAAVRMLVTRDQRLDAARFGRLPKEARTDLTQLWFDARRKRSACESREMIIFFAILLDLPDHDFATLAWQLRLATINWLTALFPGPPPALQRSSKAYWTDLEAMGRELAKTEPHRYGEPQVAAAEPSLALETEAQAAVMALRRGDAGTTAADRANPILGWSLWHPGDAIRLTPEQHRLTRRVTNGANGSPIAGDITIEGVK